jgi:hypothetical protein
MFRNDRPQNCAPGHIQERDGGGRNAGHACHGRRHADGDFFQIAQRNLFRHKLFDRQAKVSNDGNDKANADGLGDRRGLGCSHHSYCIYSYHIN